MPILEMGVAGKDCKTVALWIGDEDSSLENNKNLDKKAKDQIKRLIAAEKSIGWIYGEKQDLVWVTHPKKVANQDRAEGIRKAGAMLASELKGHKVESISISKEGAEAKSLELLIEGLGLGLYEFSGYKKAKGEKKLKFKKIWVENGGLEQGTVDRLNATIESVNWGRDLVNAPLNKLNAEKLGELAKEMAKEMGLEVDVLNKKKIESLKMGGLLSVNLGSQDPPVFIILEWKPKNAKKDQKPIVLIGKGVVYDTGGLTLKPTPGGMDTMKSDMAGAAAVLGTMRAVAQMGLDIPVVALMPVTDNRPGENAMVPGDVIEIMDGTTIEVLNTDAEGRLILADALCYAKRYEPELVIDLATLTGAAARAVGPFGGVLVGTAEPETKAQLIASGYAVYERLVEFPLWDEFADLIKSDIADMANVGNTTMSGAITASKFLQHFTTGYPWMHLDIAGVAFASSADAYRPKNGTGFGIRLLLDFLRKIAEQKD